MVKSPDDYYLYNDENLDEASDLFFQALNNTLKSGTPSREIIRRAVVKGLDELVEHAPKYGINISKLDTVKLISFSSFHLLPELSERFNISQEDIYFSIIALILFSYKVQNIKYHPDGKNTARILTQFYHPEEGVKSDNNKMAVYSYFKGMQESFVSTYRSSIEKRTTLDPLYQGD